MHGWQSRAEADELIERFLPYDANMVCPSFWSSRRVYISTLPASWIPDAE
jgi:hypothetical protein